MNNIWEQLMGHMQQGGPGPMGPMGPMGMMMAGRPMKSGTDQQSELLRQMRQMMPPPTVPRDPTANQMMR